MSFQNFIRYLIVVALWAAAFASPAFAEAEGDCRDRPPADRGRGGTPVNVVDGDRGSGRK